MQYELSKEVERVAAGVIKQHLPELKSKSIVYVTQELKDDKTGLAVPQKRKGKAVIGDIKIVGGLNAFLASGEARTDHNGPTPFSVLVVSKFAWNELKPEQREAWLHSQLYRLDYDEDTGKPSIADFDIKENSMTVKLYGAYNVDLSTFLKAAKQHPLFEDLDNQLEEVAAAPATASAEAKQQAKILKGGKTEEVAGNGNGNGHAQEAPKANGVSDLKAEVARRRGGRQPRAN